MDNKKQGSAQAMAFASQLAPAIIGVLSFMLLVRMVSRETLGQYMLYMAAIALCEMIKSGGLQSALVMRLSGSTKEQQLRITGSAYYIGAIMSGSLSLVLGILYFTQLFAKQPGIQVFCGWYALLGLVTLPLHIAEANAVAKQNIRFLLYLRLAQTANAVIVAVYAYLRGGSVEDFATIQLLSTTGLMLVVVVSGKTNPLHIKYRCSQEIKEIFKLIKYTLATLTATNLLKSADTFLIGSFMGSSAVAAYAIPLKLTELFEIPLRSLSTTAFPQLAATFNNNNPSAFRKYFVQYLSWAYLIYLPALVIAFVFAPYLVVLLGGAQYAGTAGVFRVFILFGLLLPADRMTGISLDALQRPDKNFRKVLIMAFINIAGDLLAIFGTGKLEWVAFASVLNAATGVMVGWWLLNRTGVLGVGGYKKAFNECYVYSTTFVKRNILHLVKAA